MQLNNLSGSAWVKLSKSTWITQKLLAWSGRVPLKITSKFLIKGQSNKVNIMSDYLLDDYRTKLIELFTQKGKWVFDPYLQSGDILRATLSADREFIGIGKGQAQCQKIWEDVDVRLKSKSPILLYDENSVNISDAIKTNSIDFLLSELPAFDFKRNSNGYCTSLVKLEEEMRRYLNKLKPKAYVALIVSDQRYQGRYYCRHADVIRILDAVGLSLQGLINVIQDRQALKAYGYPTTYVPNIVSQFVVIARR